MQYFANKFIRVSDISSYMMCPRLAFFRRRDGPAEHTIETIRFNLLREISVSLYSVVSADDRLATIERTFDTACEDLGIIYGLSAEEIGSIAGNQLDHIISGLESEVARIGRERLLNLLKSESTRVSLRSDKLRLSGTVDRIVAADGKLIPTVVSASQPPENGIYRSDRIRLAAYALLVSERYGCEVDCGIIEYMGNWCIREADIRKGDKREALSVRRRIEEMRSAMPDARRGKWCEKCACKDRCVARVSFMDSFFRKP